jgi:hypothetical protein
VLTEDFVPHQILRFAGCYVPLARKGSVLCGVAGSTNHHRET